MKMVSPQKCQASEYEKCVSGFMPSDIILYHLIFIPETISPKHLWRKISFTETLVGMRFPYYVFSVSFGQSLQMMSG